MSVDPQKKPAYMYLYEYINLLLHFCQSCTYTADGPYDQIRLITESGDKNIHN